jgi:hypothetical protein
MSLAMVYENEKTNPSFFTRLFCSTNLIGMAYKDYIGKNDFQKRTQEPKVSVFCPQSEVLSEKDAGSIRPKGMANPSQSNPIRPNPTQSNHFYVWK